MNGEQVQQSVTQPKVKMHHRIKYEFSLKTLKRVNVYDQKLTNDNTVEMSTTANTNEAHSRPLCLLLTHTQINLPMSS
jgi:hypothetical protein